MKDCVFEDYIGSNQGLVGFNFINSSMNIGSKKRILKEDGKQNYLQVSHRAKVSLTFFPNINLL
jgi:hypothetical protein